MKIMHNPIDLQGLWSLMERHLQYVRFRKCKIHSIDSQRLMDTDLCEWTEDSGNVCLESRACGPRDTCFFRLWPHLQSDSKKAGSAQQAGAHILNRL